MSCPQSLYALGDHRAAALARVEERVAVDLARDGVVDDVAALEPLVLALKPRIDPEALDADDLFLLVAHRARHVHHVNDDCVRDRLGDRAPRAVTLVLRMRNDDRQLGRVRARRDRALQRLAVRTAKVPERLGPDAPQAGVAILLVDQLALALVLDVGQLELLAEDRGELVERHVDFDDVLPRALARLLAAVALALFAADRVARLAVALPRAALLFVAVAKMRNVDLRNRDRDEVLALSPDELAL